MLLNIHIYILVDYVWYSTSHIFFKTLYRCPIPLIITNLVSPAYINKNVVPVNPALLLQLMQHMSQEKVSGCAHIILMINVASYSLFAVMPCQQICWPKSKTKMFNNFFFSFISLNMVKTIFKLFSMCYVWMIILTINS